ncbi:MAG: hypothetical protein IPN20_03120 [Haliscomenobacter sp.]|nr:hypothetical protein [Haliscomenobacter sp.]
MEKDGVKTVHAESREAWRRWLEVNHQQEKSVWLIIYRKRKRQDTTSTKPCVSAGSDSKPGAGRGSLPVFARNRN